MYGAYRLQIVWIVCCVIGLAYSVENRDKSVAKIQQVMLRSYSLARVGLDFSAAICLGDSYQHVDIH